MSKDYQKLDLIPFGHALLDTLDLDPIYVILVGGNLDKKLLYRWILSYLFFYHAGVASKIAESEDFYRTAQQAQNEKWLRGRERRHFRGKQSQYTLDWMKVAFPQPEKAIESLIGAKTFAQVWMRLDSWPMFGAWAIFKTADLLDRVVGNPVKLDIDDLRFYDAPYEAAKMWFPKWSLKQTVEYVLEQYKDRQAPPRFERPFGILEAETCLCKSASHMNDHYPVGNDTHEISEHLEGWGDLAKELKKHLPKDILNGKKK